MADEQIKLIIPTEALREQFELMVQEFRQAGEEVPFPGGCWKEGDNFASYMARTINYAWGENIPHGWIPGTAWWLVHGRRILGACDLRHRLTDALCDFGGHIGYSIRPAARGNGYGTLVLKLALVKIRIHGISRVRITTAVDNIASRRVIESNGFQLESESHSQNAGRATRRYWLERNE